MLSPDCLAPRGDWIPFFDDADRKQFCSAPHLSPAQEAQLDHLFETSDYVDLTVLGPSQLCTLDCAAEVELWLPVNGATLSVSIGRDDAYADLGWDRATSSYFAQIWPWESSSDDDPLWYRYGVPSIEALESALGFSLAPRVRTVLVEASIS